MRLRWFVTIGLVYFSQEAGVDGRVMSTRWKTWSQKKNWSVLKIICWNKNVDDLTGNHDKKNRKIYFFKTFIFLFKIPWEIFRKLNFFPRKTFNIITSFALCFLGIVIVMSSIPSIFLFRLLLEKLIVFAKIKEKKLWAKCRETAFIPSTTVVIARSSLNYTIIFNYLRLLL